MQGDGGAPGEESPYAQELLRAVGSAFGPWFRRRLREIAGRDDERLDAAAQAAADWVADELAALLSADAEAQRTNPLHLLRTASRFAVPVLGSMGVPVPVRDEFEERAMPDDSYGIGPLAWIDLGDDVHEAGITWGAWKAATIISRRRTAGD